MYSIYVKNIKYSLLCLIIFSNTSFGKDFKELFTIYEPVEDAKQIEKSVNESFNTMVYRLSGSSSPSNIWKIINAGNSRKDFISSYSVENRDDNSYLKVNFDKDLLIDKFIELKIPIVGNSRPVILFIIKVETGASDPYFVSPFVTENTLDTLIKNSLKNFSDQRGIFMELPDLDLQDRLSLLNYEKLIDSKNFISSKYESDKVITIDLTKIGLTSWSVGGDINFQYDDINFNDHFISAFNSIVDANVDSLLQKSLIDISKEGYLEIKIKNIFTLNDYENSKSLIKNLVGSNELSLESFDLNTITYKLKIYGSYKSIEKQLSDSSFFEILNTSFNEDYLHLAYMK